MLVAATGIIAQENQVELDEVIVSANRVEQEEGEVARSTTIVTREQIEEGNYSTLSEVLSEQAGVFVVGSNQTPGQLNTMFLRGANSDQFVFMIDGVKITDPSGVNNAIDLMEISLANIERIEIIRGSHGVMYGSSAIGGVVNIITRKAGEDGFSASLLGTSGAFGVNTAEYDVNAHLAYNSETGIYINIDAVTNMVRGLDATTDTITNPATYNQPDYDNFSRNEFQGKAGYKNEQWDLWWSYKLTEQSSDIDDGAYNDDDNYTVDFNRSLIGYGVNYKLNETISIGFNGGYTSMERIAIDDSSFIDASETYDQEYFRGTYKGNVLTNDLQFDWHSDWVSVSAGGGHYNESMNNETYTYLGAWAYEADYSLDTLDPNAQMAYGFANFALHCPSGIDFWEKVRFDIGARFTNHSIFGAQTNYQALFAGMFDEETMGYVSYSTGFNAPSLYRLYEPTAHWMSGITRGNPNLKAETSNSAEMGVKHRSEWVDLSAAMFITVVENAVEYVYLWDGAKDIDSLGFGDDRGDTYINLSKQLIRGFELSGTYRMTDKLSISGNVSVLFGKITVNEEDVDNEQTEGNHVQLFESGMFVIGEQELIGLTRRSSTGNLLVSYKPTEKLSFSAGMRYIGPRADVFYDGALGPFGALNTQPVDEFVLYDAGVFYRLNERLTANLKVRNVLDKGYTEIYGYNTQGRSIRLTLGLYY